MIRSPAVWPRKRERGAQSYSRSGSRSRILCLCLADPAPPIIESCAGSCLINAFAPVIKMKNTGVRDDRHCKHRNLALHYRYYMSNKREDIVCKCSFQGNETVDSQWQTKQSLSALSDRVRDNTIRQANMVPHVTYLRAGWKLDEHHQAGIWKGDYGMSSSIGTSVF